MPDPRIYITYCSYVIKCINCSKESFEIGGAEARGRDGAEAAAAALSPEELSCPSENVISTRYRCKVSLVNFNGFNNLFCMD